MSQLSNHHTHIQPRAATQILGFGPTGKPILPQTAHSNDPEVIRREKMGWEEISIQASKIISFSGQRHMHPLARVAHPFTLRIQISRATSDI